jgi:ATP-binding cassette subfamily B protein
MVYLYLGVFVGVYFLHVTLRCLAFRFYNFFETQIFKDLLDDAFAHVHRLSEAFFINTFTGSIISKITRARTRIETFEDQLFLRIIPTCVVMVGSMGLLALRFPLLAVLVGIYFIVLLGISLTVVIRFMGPNQAAYAAAQDVTNAHLADSVSGIATTKAYAQEKREISGFSDVTEVLRFKNHRAYISGNVVGFLQSYLLGGMLTLLLGGGTWYFLHGEANVEDMAYLTLAYTIIQSYLRELSYNLKDILTASYDLHAVIELLREEPGVKDVPNATPLSVTGGAIDFNGVTFTYPGKHEPIFSSLSLSIKAGERVALVGHSGSGKTSFVRLVQRAYDVQSGSISIDKQDIAKGTQASLRGNIALVPQDPILFHRSLSENIAYARPGASFDDVRAAARQAHIDDFIMGLPLQYETLVGERGVKLSGGERQRVAIARAILANRPILILDEATSSLDSVSEKAIQDALHTLTHGRTSIMIAHRLSTILEADRILVFDKGRVVEEGTHADLLAKNGIYAGFFKLQSGGFIGE